MTRVRCSQPITTRLVAALVVFGVVLTPRITAQTLQTQQAMREKLRLSQDLLAGLVTSNWAILDRNTRALIEVTKRPGWQVLRAPEYMRHTSAFLQATRALDDAAIKRDATRALTAYTTLVMSCVECHRYVARSRLAER
jgi:hypothetical protein